MLIRLLKTIYKRNKKTRLWRAEIMSKIDKTGLPYANRNSWLMWVIINVFLIGSITLGSLSLSYSWIYISLTLIIFSALNFFLVYSSFVTIPETYVWVVSFFGKFSKEYTAGSYFIFPWVHKIDGEVCKARKTANVFPDKTDLTEFTDGISAYIEAKLAYAITDPIAWTYGAQDSTALMMIHVIDKFRAYLESKDYEEVKRDRQNFNLASILKVASSSDYESSDIFVHIRDVMGITLYDIALEDIKLSPDDIKIRDEKYLAEKGKEIAQVKAKTTIINAQAKKAADIKDSEAKKIALENIGLGYQGQIRSLNQVMPNKDAKEYLKELAKWQSIEKTSNGTIIVEGNSSEVSRGAKFGAGFGKGNNSSSNKSKP